MSRTTRGRPQGGESGNPLLRETSGFCPLRYVGHPVSYGLIAEWLSKEDNEYISSKTVKKWFEHTVSKVRLKMAAYPVIREWIEDSDTDWEVPKWM